MAKKEPEEKTSRRGQLRQAWQMAYKVDRRLPLIVAAVFVVVLAIFLTIGFIIGNPWTFGIIGITSGVVAALLVFGRRAERAALKTVEGQAGAGASVLTTLRKGWTLSPAVAVTRNQDLVHRLTGRAGVVLVAEGRPASATNLLTVERKKIQRVAPDAPVHEILVGDEAGQVPLRKLTRTVMRLPRALKPGEVNQLNYRLKALDNQRGQLPIPKGPMPKGARMPKVPRA
jgi:Domain of unknown function (DUF4191)